jgi:hypothetical protein
MANYFSYVPEIDYVNRFPNAKIGEYNRAKNLFTRAKIRDDIFQDLSNFTKYSIVGDERPDNVSYAYYGDATYDWLVLLANNIVDVYSEWPMTQQSFDTFLINKYGTYDEIDSVHHYESVEVTNSRGIKILDAGLNVPSNFSVTYFDSGIGTEVTKTSITREITNRVFEDKLEDKKRNVYLLKKEYLNMITQDVKNVLEYKEGSTQYVSRTLKRVDNIRLYQ